MTRSQIGIIQNQLTYKAYDSTKDKTLEELNYDIEAERLKQLCEITDASHPGSKFRRFFEDMKKKLTLDAKIISDYFPENKSIAEETKEKDNNTESKNEQKKLDVNKILEVLMIVKII